MIKSLGLTLGLICSCATAEVMLDLHADSTGSTFIDSSQFDHISTNNGAVKTSMESVFGGQSMLFNSTSSLYFDDKEHWNFGADDFTIDFWLKRNGNISGVQTPLSQWHSSTGLAFIFLHHPTYHSTNEIGFWLNGQVISQLKGTIGADWTHVAAIRSGEVIRLYFDGVQVGSDYNVPTNFVVNNSAAKLKVGNQQNDNDKHGWEGYIDEVRIANHAFDPATFPPEQANCNEEADYNQDGVVNIHDLLLRQTELNNWIEKCWEPSLQGEDCQDQ